MFMGGAQGLINILHTRRSPNRGCGSMWFHSLFPPMLDGFLLLEITSRLILD
jgi:hypothetical protein